MEFQISDTAKDLLRMLSANCSTSIVTNQFEMVTISQGQDIFHQQIIFSEIEPVSIVNEVWATANNKSVDLGFPTPDLEAPLPAQFLRMHDCHIIDEAGYQRPILVGLLNDFQNSPRNHGVLTLIYPESDNTTNLATYNVISDFEEYSRMRLTGVFASIVLGDKAGDIATWVRTRESVCYGWRCLAIVVEYLLLLRNASPVLLNWSAEVKSQWLREAFKRVGETAKLQQPAKEQETLPNKRKRSDLEDTLSSVGERVQKGLHKSAAGIDITKGDKPRMLAIIRLGSARLAYATGITHDRWSLADT